MKNIIIENKHYRVVKQTVSYIDLERKEAVKYIRFKLQERILFFWKTIVIHPYISDNKHNDDKGTSVYINLFRCIVSAKIII